MTEEPSRQKRRIPARWRAGYIQAIAAVAGATVVSRVLFALVAPANLTMTYLLAIVVIAARYGRGPSIVAVLASVAAFDFFFVPPYLTFVVTDTQYLLTFAVMLTVGLVIGSLTARIRRQAEAAEQRERRTAALYAMSRELAQAGATDQLVAIAARHIAEVFGADVTIHLGEDVGDDEVEAVCLPLLGHGGGLGVVRVRPRRRHTLVGLEPRRQLETFVNQTALALERARLADEAREARVGAETERLRSSLLSSVSHDLRTPLATITGAVSTILEGGDRLDTRTRTELLESVRDEAERLNRLVQNLLQMTRLESRALQVRREWHPLEEVIGAALRRLATALAGHKVVVNVPPDLPLVAIDDVLIEQVLVNLLDNAAKYTPAGSLIRVIATATDDRLTVEVSDHGPGLPPGEEERVFDKFHRAEPHARRGAGLGLAICRGIVEAHGGRIWAQNLPEGGVAFLFTLPVSGTRPAAVPADA